MRSLSAGIVMTTDYSGIGTPELCASMICSAAKAKYKLAGGSTSLIVWRAGDVDASCRKVLLSHSGDSRAEHISGCILQRAQRATIVTLEGLLTEHQKHFHDALAVATSETWSPHIRPPTRSELLMEHGHAFMEAAIQVMEMDELRSKVWCFKHQCKCDINPPAEVVAGKLFVHSAGWTCAPWSSMSRTRMRWLHKCSIVFLIWLFSTLQARPHIILGECVISFDDDFLKGVMSRYGYTLHTFELDPVLLGIPSCRPRKYMVMVRDETFQLTRPFTPGALSACCHRELVCDARIYMVAPRSAKTSCAARFAQIQGLPAPEGPLMSWSTTLLDETKRQWLQSYHEIAHRQNIKRFFICNLSQRPVFWKRVTRVCPALLRKVGFIL